MSDIKSDFDSFDSKVLAIPRCTLCGWSVKIPMPSTTSPKKVTERANKAMTVHLRRKHGVTEKGVSPKGKKWV